MFDNLQNEDEFALGPLAPAQKATGGPVDEIRPHEIYEHTSYIPNKSMRLLDIPMNSSLTF